MNREDLSFNPAATNRHPVDQLALVREQRKVLEAQEEALKLEVLAGMGRGTLLGGDEYLASATTYEKKGAVDPSKAKKAGVDLDLFRKKPVKVTTIRVERRALNEEAA